MRMEKYPYQGIEGLSNIETEGGETINLPNGETYSLVGKKHSAGGIPTLAVNQTKIYSQKLKAPKEVTEEITGKKYQKKKSFADLSKMFPTNPYKKVLENKIGMHDELSTRTAQLMLDKMKAQQENIFFAQESYKADKGMDNGMNNLQDELIMKMGGSVPKYYDGGYPPPMNGIGWDFELGTYRPPSDSQWALGNPDLANYVPNYATGVYNPYVQSNTLAGYNIPDGQQPFVGNNYADPYTEYNQTFHPRVSADKDLFQQRHNDWYQRNLGVSPRYDMNPNTPLDGITGRMTSDATDLQYTRQATFSGYVNRDAWDRLSPDEKTGVAQRYNLTPSQIQADFDVENIGRVNIKGVTDRNIDRLPTPGINPLQVPAPQLPNPVDPASPQYDDQPYNFPEERRVAKPVDPNQLFNTVNDGYLLGQLGSLSMDNPYYNYAQQKPAQQRFNPVNTLANERAYNMQRMNLMSSGLPSTVQNALLGQGQAALQEGVNNVNINNFQGDQQNDNQNTAAIVNAYNQNSQSRNIANQGYVRDLARGKELFGQQKHNLISRLRENWKSRLDSRNKQDLMNQMFRNYEARGMNVDYLKGSTANPMLNPNMIANMYNQGLATNQNNSDISGMTKKQLQDYILQLRGQQ